MSQEFRCDALDGLRGLAALTVAVSHYSNATGMLGGILGHGAGQLGVMLFFALSGLLMGRLYLGEAPTAIALVTFARRRAARVVPLYLAVVLASYWLGARFLPAVDAGNLANHLLFWRGASVLWTIPVEVQFYALFPLLWLGRHHLGPAVWAWVALALVAVAMPGSPAPDAAGPGWAMPAVTRYLPFFVVGLGVSQVDLPTLRRSRYADGLFALALLAYVLAFPMIRAAFGWPSGPLWESPLYMALMGVLLFAASHSRLASATFGTPPARGLGAISYSMYLLHLPILGWIAGLAPLRDHTALGFLAFLGATVAASAASFYTLENPTRRWLSGRLSSRPRTAFETP